MLGLETVYRDLESVEAVLAPPAPNGGRGLVSLLALQEARAALAREQAAIEAEDVLSQAEEALVMG